MDLRQCLENLKHDINNGGIEDDSFPTVCYVTMANAARRLLETSKPDQQEADNAREYLSLCRKAGSDSLRYAAEA